MIGEEARGLRLTSGRGVDGEVRPPISGGGKGSWEERARCPRVCISQFSIRQRSGFDSSLLSYKGAQQMFSSSLSLLGRVRFLPSDY